MFRMTRGKRKRKRKPLFDFVVPHSLEECAYRVGHIQEIRDIAFAPTIRIRLTPVDDDTYSFQVREVRPGSIHLVGYLNRLDKHTTYVSGMAAIRPIIYLEMIPLAGVIFALMFFAGWMMGLLFFPPLIVFALRTWRGVRKERERLIRLTKGILGY
jgi:hypothetical protein